MKQLKKLKKAKTVTLTTDNGIKLTGKMFVSHIIWDLEKGKTKESDGIIVEISEIRFEKN